jgi:hypothetical protein
MRLTQQIEEDLDAVNKLLLGFDPTPEVAKLLSAARALERAARRFVTASQDLNDRPEAEEFIERGRRIDANTQRYAEVCCELAGPDIFLASVHRRVTETDDRER